jgi:hypothetical protein
MKNNIIQSIRSIINFFIEIKHISVSQWDVEQEDTVMHYDNFQQRR